LQEDGKENGDEENAPALLQRHRNIHSPSVQQAALRPISPGRAETLGVELADLAAAAAAGAKPQGSRAPKALKSLFWVGRWGWRRRSCCRCCRCRCYCCRRLLPSTCAACWAD
jgi:hypothetical protein